MVTPLPGGSGHTPRGLLTPEGPSGTIPCPAPVGKPPPGAPSLGGGEERDPRLVGHDLEPGPHRHPDPDVLGGAVHDVGHDPGALFEVDERDDVGDPVPEGTGVHLADHGDAVDGAPSAGVDPFHRPPAHPAPVAGIELARPAIGAPLHDEAPVVGRRPVRGGVVVRDRRRAGFGRPLVGSGRSAIGHGASRPRTRVAPVESMPPVPCATAMRAPGTWVAWASPRSWRTASTIRNMPRM